MRARSRKFRTTVGLLDADLIPNQLINDTDAIVPAEPPPGPQFWGSMSDSKPPELGVWGPEVSQQIVDLVLQAIILDCPIGQSIA
jgi:hypothetical protein